MDARFHAKHATTGEKGGIERGWSRPFINQKVFWASSQFEAEAEGHREVELGPQKMG